MRAKQKIPRARGGLTARPHSCVSEHAFKLNQGGKEYQGLWTNCRKFSERER